MISTIHLLRAGAPLCGFAKGYPRDWPEGNKWQPFDKIDGGLAGQTGVLGKELLRPDKWRACRGCVRQSLRLLSPEKGEDAMKSLLEGLGMKYEAEGSKA